ncbi:hypothetical protein ONZ45_g17771 [Pleurotus djamor]|nr:hypothetical protein ONZ45_g17771 [Pleurotus djamor]
MHTYVSTNSARSTTPSTRSGVQHNAPPPLPPPPSLNTNPAKNTKRGLAFAAFPSPNDILHANQSASVISWHYDWSSSPTSSAVANSHIEYVPMQWGTNNLAGLVKARGAKTVLGFNEPDFSSQSNLSPGAAAALWKQHIQPLKSSLGVMKLVSPAISSAGTGIPWLQNFIAACSGCTIDAIAVHWYGSGSKWFIQYLNKVHSTFPGAKIWVTEFAETSADMNMVSTFMKEALPFLDSTPWIERYAWFAYMRPQNGVAWNLLDGSGNLNTIGKIYVTP